MEPGHIALRCLFAYVVLLALLRASGKSAVAQGTPFDFVLALALGDLIDDLLWAEVSAASFAVAAGTLVLAHAGVATLVARSAAAHDAICGRPARLLRSGLKRRAEMRDERVNDAELAAMLRTHGVELRRRVEHVLLETSGHTSVVPWPAARAVQRRDREALRGRLRS